VSGAPLVAIVTGAASGIGAHLTGALAVAGHRVIATDADVESLEARARERAWPAAAVLVRRLDVRDAVAWPAVVELATSTWGRLDLLLNVAGYLRPGFAHASTVEDVDRHLDVNTKGVIHGTRAAAAVMVRQGGGHIVNLASLAGLCPVPGLSLYAASKFAVRGFSLSAAHELRAHGVAVTVVCPDAVETPMLERQVDSPEAALTFSGGRALSVDHVARLILDRVIPRRPLEVVIPRSRGWLARIVSTFPRLGIGLLPLLLRKGRARQRAIRSRVAGPADRPR
jgi:3-oxoacyl-[acyl-carrier protein] reductase